MDAQSILALYKPSITHKKPVKRARVYDENKNQGTKNDILRVVKEFSEIRTANIHEYIGKSKTFTQMCVRCLIRENKLKRIKKPIGHHNTNVHFVRLANDCS